MVGPHTEVTRPHTRAAAAGLQLCSLSQTALREVAAVAVYIRLSLLSVFMLFPTAEAKVFVALAWRVGILFACRLLPEGTEETGHVNTG